MTPNHERRAIRRGKTAQAVEADLIENLKAQMLEVLGLILGGVLLAVGRALLRLIHDKLDLDGFVRLESLDRAWERLTDHGIAFAEQRSLRWAAERNELPEGTAKLEWAVQWIAEEARARKLPEKARDELVRLIEARLGHPDAPGASVRGQDAANTIADKAARGATVIPLVLVLGLLLPFGTACEAEPTDVAQTIATSAARALVAIDGQVAPRIEQQGPSLRSQLLAEGKGGQELIDAWEEGMRPFVLAEKALRVSHAALFALQDGIDTWRLGDRGASWHGRIGCAAQAVEDLEEALREADIPVPPEVTSLVDALAAYTAKACTDERLRMMLEEAA